MDVHDRGPCRPWLPRSGLCFCPSSAGVICDRELPFALLCVGIPVIATSGVIGTALLALGRLRLLGVQVGGTLALNLVALAVLVPWLGSVGAALAR